MNDLIKPARLDEDGTLWIELNDQDVVEDYETIDKINRVIVTSSVWCKMFYMEDDTLIECNNTIEEGMNEEQ